MCEHLIIIQADDDFTLIGKKLCQFYGYVFDDYETCKTCPVKEKSKTD